MGFKEIYHALCEWADARNLNDVNVQYLKYKEESGELAAHFLKGKTEFLQDDLGDTMVTVFMVGRLNGQGEEIAEQLEFAASTVNIDPSRIAYFLRLLDEEVMLMANAGYACYATIASMIVQIGACIGESPYKSLLAAWNEIKNRKGKTVNGAFVKDADIKNETHG